MLLNMIKEDLVFSNNSTVSQLPVEKQLAITLFRFGHNRNAASVEAIAQWAGVCCGTIVDSTCRVMIAFLALHDSVICWCGRGIVGLVYGLIGCGTVWLMFG